MIGETKEETLTGLQVRKDFLYKLRIEKNRLLQIKRLDLKNWDLIEYIFHKYQESIGIKSIYSTTKFLPSKVTDELDLDEETRSKLDRWRSHR